MLRISYRNKDLCQEVYTMIVPELKLPTDEYYEVVHENDALKRTLKLERAKNADQLADRDAKIADRDAKIAEYKRLYGDL